MSAALLATLLALAAAWQRPAPGVETLAVEEEGAAVQLVRFDLRRFRPEVAVLGPEGARTAAALRRERGAAAVINGGFFDAQRRPLGLRVAAGRTVVPFRPRVDWGVLVLRGERAQVVHSREFQREARVDGAIQVGPRLLAAGRPLRLKPQVARRSAVALDRDGTTLTLVVAPFPMEAGRLARVLAGLGFHSALLLDGGASTQASVSVGRFQLDVAGAYPVPDALVVRPR